jgi:hypothetical protein
MQAWRLALIVGVICLAGVSLRAQTNTGEIGGVVKDSNGGVLQGATVVARHAATGTTIERLTNSQGRFFLPALRTGQWEVTASSPGFAAQTQRGFVLEIGRTLELSFTLMVGDLA